MTQLTNTQLIEEVNEIGIALSKCQDPLVLQEKILRGAKRLSHADGGTLYTIRDNALHFEIVLNDSLHIYSGGTDGTPIEFSPIPLPNDISQVKNVVVNCAMTGKAVHIPNVYTETNFDFSAVKIFDARSGYLSKSFLTVPLFNQENELIAVLQLINAKDPITNELVPFSDEAQHLVASLASQAAVAMSNNHLEGGMHHIFESFISVLAEAIDEKSSSTGRHCRQVPIITKMIAEAVNTTKEGHLGELKFSEEDLYELNVAAWLHDCGKIVTPIHIETKSTRLETIVDKINLIDLRFELLRRSELSETEKTEIEEEQNFVRRCNHSSTLVSESDRLHLESIASRKWTDSEGNEHPLITKDELACLSIPEGTLDPMERAVIEEHAATTLAMLSKLPFPKHLKNVTEIAASHHERIDGNGYPRGLKGEEMSVQAKILCLADVFEALTAGDRSYKQAKKMSEVLNILETMTKEGHIDPDVFNIFMKKKVYQNYAEGYLSADLLDC
jgi:HD-GYP domain-containing protein (c-di-GMP phosphodiesterase class II)